MSAFGGELLGFLNQIEVCAVTYPVKSGIYFSSSALLFILLILCVHGRRYKAAFWWVIGLILTDFAFSFGHDTTHHVYRILALADQVRQRHLDLLLTNPVSGEAFPVFVYYNFLPYLLPVTLNLAGVPALLAFKIAMGLQLIVLAAGIQTLIQSRTIQDDPETSSGFLIAILFVSANYVCALWYTRAALGEIWAYSLMPWVVIGVVSPHSRRLLTATFFLQICAHPLVLPQSVVGEAMAALCLSSEPPLVMIKRCVAPLSIALILATPFWLPQFVWLHDVVGNAILPLHFFDTFLSLRDIFGSWQGLGWWLAGAVALMMVASRARLPLRMWVAIVAFVALAALQTVYFRSVVIRIPLVDQSQFVWRFMLPTAFIAFAALLAGWRMTHHWGLASLALLAAAWMVFMHVDAAPASMALLTRANHDAAVYAKFYLRAEEIWGVGLFAPDYSRLPQNCAPVDGNTTETESFAALRTGVVARQPYLLVRNAPIGFVNYTANGIELPASACRDALVLGPVRPDEKVVAAEGVLHDLLLIRIGALVAGLALILASRWFRGLLSRLSDRVKVPG